MRETVRLYYQMLRRDEKGGLSRYILVLLFYKNIVLFITHKVFFKIEMIVTQ